LDCDAHQLARPVKRLLVIGGGWAGLAAAVRATQRGAQVTLLDMAPQWGGRARSWDDPAHGPLDSGQHILIGAYRDTLALMRTVGAEPDRLLQRLPLTLVNPQGQGLVWGRGAPAWAAVQAVWRHPLWSQRDRLGLAWWGLRMGLRGLQAPAGLSVAQLCADLPEAVQRDLVEPLCVAALNTRMAAASAEVFMRVLRDALFGGPGAADLLLPAAPLQALLPTPAAAWLQARGATLHTGSRAQALTHADGAWHCGAHSADAVILATSATEAARLAQAHNPGWSACTAALPAEAIATVEWEAHSVRLAAPMVALAGGPAQFLFDLAQIDTQAGTAQRQRIVAVASAVAAELDDGLEPLAQRIEAQVAAQVPALAGAVRVRSHVDRRATFACLATLQRPPAAIAAGLWAAGDYVDGPYPATLEAAVRTGNAAAEAAVPDNHAT
jgi:hydroxysqualene dehydroxylase